MDGVRRLVSGKKARYTQEGFDLDLIQLTDRIIIMGYPADGFAALYRNKRADVLRFLEPFAPHYRIFNLCPAYENSYDPAAFTHQNVERDNAAVERYPWPDHHPPPLSLMPVMVDGVRRWYEADERNVVVIHCKAGKGRSGSFALSFLLSQPGLPSAPSTSASTDGEEAKTETKVALDPREVIGKTGAEIANLSMKDKLEYLLRFHTVRRMSPGATKYGVSIASQRRHLGYFGRQLEGDDPRLPRSLDGPPSPIRRIVLEFVKIKGPGLKTVGKVLSGGKDKMAIQVYRYKDSIAGRLRRRELALAEGSAPPPEANEDEWEDKSDMFVQVGGLVEAPSEPIASSRASSPATQAPAVPTPASSSKLPVSSAASSASASTASLPSAVLDAPSSASSSPSRSSTPSLPPPSGTSAYAETEAADSLRTSRTRTLVPRTSYIPPALNPLDATNPPRRSDKEARRAAKEDGGIVLDGDREVQLRFLVGETGKKHAKLPEMAALALTWIIPAFECPPSAGERAKIRIEAKELDFLKPFAGIEEVEIGWRWLD
ncbi:hypothetical protein JCM8097_004307 [Rhodosporidiobolus ruineniae]